MKRTNIIFLCAIILLLAISCSEIQSPLDDYPSKQYQERRTTNNPISLQDVTWILISITNTKSSVVTNYPSYVKQVWGNENIVFSDTTIAIKGLCNGGWGYYSHSGSDDSIKVLYGIGTTLALCKYEEWETYLWNNLDSCYQYKINVDSLEIYSKGSYNLNFVAKK